MTMFSLDWNYLCKGSLVSSCPNLEGLALGTIAESLWLVSGSHRFSIFLKCFVFSSLWDFLKSHVVLCTVFSR